MSASDRNMGMARKMLMSAVDVGRIVRATGYSLSGLRQALDNEAAFRQELILFVVLAPLGIWLGQSGVERALLIGSLLLVLVTELLNSAIEAAVDRFGKEPHPLAARAKDMGSAAVLLAMVLAILVWGLILADRL